MSYEDRSNKKEADEASSILCAASHSATEIANKIGCINVQNQNPIKTRSINNKQKNKQRVTLVCAGLLSLILNNHKNH
jgi:hypothetical protein